MTTRLEALKERLVNLEALKASELALKQPSSTFLQDLDESMTALKQQIENSPASAFQMVK